MSFRIQAKAWASGVPPIDRLVLVALADWANDTGQCWPSMPTVSDKTGADVRTVRRAIVRLEAAGHITAERRSGKGTLYTIHPQPAFPADTGHAALPDQGHAALSGHTALGAESPKTEGTLPPNTLGTISKRKKTTSSPSTRATNDDVPAAEPLPDLPAGVTPQQWSDYADMRTAMAHADKRRPWTTTTARKAIEKLHTLAAAGSDPGAVLDQSVLNAWQGLFPVKDDQHGNRGDHLRGSGNARTVRDRGRPVDGFTSVLRHVAFGGRSHDDGGS